MTKTRWATLLAILLPIAVLFGPVICSDRGFAMRDAAHFYHPLFEWCARQWSAGMVPLWNPYENCGLPVLADTTSSVFYPGKLLFLLPVDFVLRYKLYIVLHVVLAAAGSYWLARSWKASSHAAAIAAIAYSCGGNVVFQYCNVVFLVGAAWLPLAALAADRMLAGRSWRAAIMLGVVLALMILGGDPQAAYHGLLITGLYALVLALGKSDGASPSTGDRFRGLAARLGLTGFAAGIAFALAAVQILPSSEATKYSERAAYNQPRNIYEALRPPAGESPSRALAKGLFGKPDRGSHQELAYDFSVGPWRLVEYFWPNVGGRLLPTNRRWFSLLPVEGRTWTPTLYLGLLPALLGLASWRVRRGQPRERWLSWLVLIFTLASFGYYGLGWLATEVYVAAYRGDPAKVALAPPVGGVYWLFVTFLPTYIYFRYPAKLLPLVSLGLSQLAAIGWDRAVSGSKPRLSLVLLVFGLISGIFAFIAWSIDPALVAAAVRRRSDTSLGPFDGIGMHRDVLFAFVQAAVVALAARWLLGQAWKVPGQVRWQWSLLGLTAVELALANSWLVTSAPASVWRNESPVAAAIRALAPGELPPRVFRANLGTWRPPSFRQQRSTSRPAEAAQWEKDTLFPKYHLPSRVPLVESYGSIKLLDHESLLFVARSSGAKQPDGSYLPQATALRLLGTEFLLLPVAFEPKFAERQSPAAGSAWPEDAALWRMSRTLPRSWIVHQIEVLPPLPRPLRIAAVDQRSAEVLFPNRKARDFTRTAVVETDRPLAEWTATPRDAAKATGESCRITHDDPQRVVVAAEMVEPGMLVLSDAWFPGWQATVTTGGQSQATTIYQTNRVLRGVWLPAGKHEVEFRFRPESFVRGAWISSVSWLLLVLGLATLALRSRVRRDGTRGAPAALQIE